MSRELREKADLMMKELREVLRPLSDEITRIKNLDTLKSDDISKNY